MISLLEIVKDFKEEHLYTPGVIDLVKHFFEGYVQLIADLTHFFQKATSITLHLDSKYT